MKINEETGAIICGRCGAELKIKLVSKVKGVPSKVTFRCPTKKMGANDVPIQCSGGMMRQKASIFKLPKKTLDFYNLNPTGKNKIAQRRNRNKLLKRRKK